MKAALCTTTIHTPIALKAFRAINPDVRFFVALDQNTPEEAVNFCAYDLPNTQVVYIQDQQKWKCSELIGWQNIQRRNLAVLEALAWGAQVLIMWDDDNLFLDPAYFDHIAYAFSAPFNGIKVSSPGKWFDVGQLLDPVAPHRGFPHQVKSDWRADSVVDAKVGVAAGICLGDPDISAVTRIANHPTVHCVSELLRSGIVVDNQTWTVFNSQNTAFVRELAPAMLLCPQFKRYDDIVASLVCQRVMRERGYHVHFGQPFVWQQRNEHDLTRDLSDELWGMTHLPTIARWLDHTPFVTSGSISGMVRDIYADMSHSGWCPPGVGELAHAWLADIEQVMG